MSYDGGLCLAFVEFYDGRKIPILHYQTSHDGNVIRFCTQWDWYVGVWRNANVGSSLYTRRRITFYREELVIGPGPGEDDIRLFEEPKIKTVSFIR